MNIKKIVFCALALTVGQVQSFDWTGLGLFALAAGSVHQVHKQSNKLESKKSVIVQQPVAIEPVVEVPFEQYVAPASLEIIQVPQVHTKANFFESDEFYHAVTAACVIAAVYGSYKVGTWIKDWYQSKD